MKNIILLLDKNKRMVFEYNKKNLNCAQGSRNQIINRSKNTIFIFSENDIREVDSVEFLRYRGEKLFSKFINILNFNWYIDIKFKKSNLNESEIIHLIREYIDDYQIAKCDRSDSSKNDESFNLAKNSGLRYWFELLTDIDEENALDEL